MRSARARAMSRISSPSRRTRARNSSRSFSSQRAARSSSGRAPSASLSSSSTSSLLIIDDAESGIGRAASMRSATRAEQRLDLRGLVGRTTGTRRSLGPGLPSRPTLGCPLGEIAGVAHDGNLSASRAATIGGTMVETSPPYWAISRISFEAMNGSTRPRAGTASPPPRPPCSCAPCAAHSRNRIPLAAP